MEAKKLIEKDGQEGGCVCNIGTIRLQGKKKETSIKSSIFLGFCG